MQDLVTASGAQAAAAEPQALGKLLPGPHPVLRCLMSIHPGKAFTLDVTQNDLHGTSECKQQVHCICGAGSRPTA